MEIINPADGAVELLAVVQTGAFTRAADQLGVSPAHVSRQVKALEARLGVKLLQRTTRVVRLTEAGVNYVSAVAPLIEGLHAANQRAQEASQTLRGRIRVTAGGRYAEDIVAPILADFCLVHPEVELSLDLSTRMVDLIAEGYDLGIRYGRLLDSNLIAQRLSVFPLIAVATPDYLARCGTPERPEADRKSVV